MVYPSNRASHNSPLEVSEAETSTAKDIPNKEGVKDSGYQLDLERAKQGFERFKQSYEMGDPDWQHFLTGTKFAKEFQAVYLGVKPLMSIYQYDIKTDIMANMIKYYAGNDYTVIDMRNVEMGIMIFSESSVKKVLTAYPDYFPDYSPRLSIASYIAGLSEQSEGKTIELRSIQRGLLHGFPLTASRRFAQYADTRKRIIDLYEEDQGLSVGDRSLLSRYLNYRNKDMNKFRDEHQEEIGELLNRHFPDMDKQARQYVLALREIRLPGFVYTSDNPTSEEDRAFIQKVFDAFVVFGYE